VGSGTYVLPPTPLPPLPKNDPTSPWPLWQADLQAEVNARLVSDPVRNGEIWLGTGGER